MFSLSLTLHAQHNIENSVMLVFYGVNHNAAVSGADALGPVGV